MKIKQKMVSLFVISIFALSIISFTPIRFYPFKAQAQSGAVLTGVIYDRGVDTDGNGKFNYLEVSVEMNVFEYGYYSVEVDWLEGVSGGNGTLYISAQQSAYLDAGMRFLNLTFSGNTINSAHFNPASLGQLYLRENSGNITSELFHVPLSHTYNYSDFDSLAELTGVITDQGVDTDGDGLFDSLEVAVEVNVHDYGYYSVEVYYLQNSTGYNLPLSASDGGYFNATTTLFHLRFFGPAINKAHFNPAFLYNLRLSSWYNTIKERFNVPLSRQYNYTEFDAQTVLTGKISDRGVDTDGNGLFNFLEVGVEVNVTYVSTYEVYIQLSGYQNMSYYAYNYTVATLLPGLQVVNVSFSGPMIHGLKANVSTLYYISLQDVGFSYRLLDERYNVELSKTYNYTEFDTLAYFTGIVIDKGVDTDGDSKFEYLEVDAQINVTQGGYYDIYANGLYENSTSGWAYLSDYKYGNFGVGLQFVNFTFPSQLIYSSKVNPAYIDTIQLSGNVGYYWTTIDQLNKVHLSRTYHYYEFDPHAYLTGKVYDKGVDTDNDHLFDYLQTSIEVNVTEAGTYLVGVNGLAEKEWSPTYDYQSSGPFNLSIGVHLFNFTFYGPQIAYYEINPRNVTGIYLEEMLNSWTLDSIQSAPLSRQYYYNEFDHPFNDMQCKFTVYPDGHVAIDAAENSTHMYPRNTYGPVVNTSVSFSETNKSILGSVNGTCTLPPYVTTSSGYPYYYVQFPTNSTKADFEGEYNNGILNAELNATTILPPIVKTQYPYNTTNFTLSGTYSNGLMHARLNGSSTIPSFIGSQLPFNVTDATVLANYGNNEFKGNITLPLISGLPAGDIKVNFEGNRSDMLFTGYINVVYGTYYGTVVNATTVAELISQLNSTIPGNGQGSLYDMTEGILECTKIEIMNTTFTGGERIDYTVSIRGDFAGYLAKLIARSYFYYPTLQEYNAIYAALNATLPSVDNLSLTLVYLHDQKQALLDLSFDSNLKTLWNNALQMIPPTIETSDPRTPQYVKDQINAILKLGNATAYAAQNAWLRVSYVTTDSLPVLDLRMGLTANITQLKNDTIKVIPDLVYPTEVKDTIRSYLNTTYAMLNSCNTTVHLENGVANFKSDFNFKGDLKTQLNAAKSCYLSILNITSPYAYNWQTKLLNQTEIDINSLKINLHVGRETVLLNVRELLIRPPRQMINDGFKLSNLFNVTTSYNEPPTRYEKLKIIIQGGSDPTHTVIPSRPLTVPKPDNVSLDGKTFTWENTTMSSLKEMVFNIAYQGSYQNAGVTYYIPVLSNSTVSNFNFDPSGKTLSFSVNGTTGTSGFCNITIPKALLDVNNRPDWMITIDGKLATANCTITPNAEYTFIYIPYKHSNHTIAVTGTKAVSEIPQNNPIPILLLTSLIAIAFIVTQRKKIRVLKTKSLDIAYRMANSFSRLLKRQKNTHCFP